MVTGAPFSRKKTPPYSALFDTYTLEPPEILFPLLSYTTPLKMILYSQFLLPPKMAELLKN